MAGASGEIWIRRGDEPDIRLDLGHDISDIGVEPDGVVIALDPAGRLVEVQHRAEQTVLAEDAKLRGARGVHVSSEGAVLVAGTSSDRLFTLAAGGGLAPMTGPWTLRQPIDALVVDDRRAVVIDGEPYRVRLLDADATHWTVPLLPAVTLSGPHLAQRGDQVFVTEPVGGHVLQLDMRGRIVATYRLQVNEHERAHPVGIAVTEDGLILVADVSHNRVLSFRPES